MRSLDVLVVGAGPGGCVAAWEARLAGPTLDVLLVERDRAIGAPVRCAEGVGSRGLREFMDPDGADWVARRIDKVVLRSPDGTPVEIRSDEVGYILDRTRFEPALAAEARRAGAEVEIGAEVTGLERRPDGWLARLEGPRGGEEMLARVVIGADGVEGMVGRWAGLDTRVASRDMESCAQYTLADVDIDPDAIVIDWGHRWAPGGYAWVFPKGTRSASVGLGVVALRGDGRTARHYLDDYVAHYFPRGTAVCLTVGGLITATTAQRTVTDGIMLVGDAGHMINPLSGAGIVNAMKAGRLAGQTAAAAITEGDTSAARLQSYHEAWMALVGNDHVKYYRIKDALGRLEDDALDHIARTVNAIPPEKRTLGRVFAHALVRHPQLLPVAARFFV
jgi:digeranylgeranylglycerophospholipid reductase